MNEIGTMILIRELLLLNFGVLLIYNGRTVRYINFKQMFDNVLDGNATKFVKGVLFYRSGHLRDFWKSMALRNIKRLDFLYTLSAFNIFYYIVFMFTRNDGNIGRTINGIFSPISILVLISIFCLFTVLIYKMALKTEEENVTESMLMRDYLKFTEESIRDEGAELILIGGSLGFLGEVTKISAKSERWRKRCKSNYESSSCADGKKCNYDCIYKNKQFLQLNKLKAKIQKLRILIRDPKDNAVAKALIGKLYMDFGNKLELKYYPEGKVKLYARIIQYENSMPQMFWHWNNNDNTFGRAEPLDDKTPKGATFIYMFSEVLWEKSTDPILTKEDFIKEYIKRVN